MVLVGAANGCILTVKPWSLYATPRPPRHRRLLAPACQAGRDSRRLPRDQPYSHQRQEQQQKDAVRLLQQYALPTIGLLVVGSLVAPLVAGLIMAAVGVSIAITATAAAISISWIAVPFLVAMFGIPALMAGGMAAGAFATAAGALLIPSLIQLLLIGGGLWLGATAARRLFYGGGQGGNGVAADGTIDVQADTVDDWKAEMSREAKDREAELREFDDLLRRREAFKQRGPPFS